MHRRLFTPYNFAERNKVLQRYPNFLTNWFGGLSDQRKMKINQWFFEGSGHTNFSTQHMSLIVFRRVKIFIIEYPLKGWCEEVFVWQKQSLTSEWKRMLPVGYCEVWKGGVCGSGALPAGMLLHLHNLLLLVLLLLLHLALLPPLSSVALKQLNYAGVLILATKHNQWSEDIGEEKSICDELIFIFFFY